LSANDEAALRALHDRNVLTKLIGALARARTASTARAAFAAAVRSSAGKEAADLAGKFCAPCTTVQAV
jgi:hypothetical protein